MQIKIISKYAGQVFNVGGGRLSNLSLLETTELCQQITGNQLEVLSHPQNRPVDVLWYITDNCMAEKEFGWSVTKMPAEILTDTYKWLSDNEQLLKNIFIG